MIYHVDLAVAVTRPPHVHEFRRVTVEAKDPLDASLTALQMVACTSVMPVWCGAPVPHPVEDRPPAWATGADPWEAW